MTNVTTTTVLLLSGILLFAFFARLYYRGDAPQRVFSGNQIVDIMGGPARDFSGTVISAAYRYHPRSKTIFGYEWVYVIQIGADMVEALESDLRPE
jgi:hypothetical protein